jgi:predicted Na+-dependent transporter
MIKETNKENKKRKVLKIKYENIICLFYIVFATYQTIYHLQINGFYNYIILEILIHLMFISGLHYIIKDIRKNPNNWKID